MAPMRPLRIDPSAAPPGDEPRGHPAAIAEEGAIRLSRGPVAAYAARRPGGRAVATANGGRRPSASLIDLKDGGAAKVEWSDDRSIAWGERPDPSCLRDPR